MNAAVKSSVKPSSWLVARWPDLMNALDAAYPNVDALKEIFYNETNYWYDSGHLKSATSVKQPLRWTRSHIEETFSEEMSGIIHTAFNFTKEEWGSINSGTRVAVKVRMENQQYLYHVDEIVARGIALLASEKWDELALGLVVLTGRRVSEILYSGLFTEKTAYTANFSGQLKHGQHAISYEIPTLCRSSLIVDSITRLRGMTLPADAGNTPRDVRDLADSRFKDIVTSHKGKLTTHMFRGIATKIAIFWYCPSNVAPMHYAATIEGHRSFSGNAEPEVSYGSGVHYSDYVIATADGQPDSSQGIKLRDADVEVLETFKETAVIPEPATVSAVNVGRASGLSVASDGTLEIGSLTLPADVVAGIQEAMAYMGKTDMNGWIVDAIRQQTNFQRGLARRSGDVASMSTEKLKGVKTAQATNERIRRAVVAIDKHNDACSSPMERWFINATAVHGLVAGRLPLISAYIVDHQAEIDALNSKHSLTVAYNRKPMAIADMVRLPE